MYYHATSIGGIKELKPDVSEHQESLIYFSTKRENVLVYLSNAILKYAKETSFEFSGKCKTWGPYGFTNEGLLRLEEYYPNALEDTYKGVSGYIYSVDNIIESGVETQIKDCKTTKHSVKVQNVEFIEDAYAEILKAEQAGLIKILRYGEMPEKGKIWLENVIREDYETTDHPEYKHFLINHFEFLQK